MKKLIFTLIALAAVTGVVAQRTATDFFTSAPGPIMPLLDKVTRLDMVDYFHAGSGVDSKNLLEGHSRIIRETPEAIVFQLTDSVTCQLSIVTTAPSDTLLCMITTMRLSLVDSQVKFYTTSWQTPRKAPMAMPGVADWVPNKNARAKVREQLPFITANWEYFPTTQTLVATPTIKGYFHKGELPEAISLLPENITYKWTGKVFKLQKQ